MNPYEALAALVRAWEETRHYLDEHILEQLRAAFGELRAAPDGTTRERAAVRAVTIVAAAVPPTHPVRLANAGQARSTATAEDWTALADELLRLAVDGARPVTALMSTVQGRLLAAPALTWEQVRAGGRDPQASGLIRLAHDDGEVRLPAFQFGPSGRPRELVTRINQALDADTDPWGVADWWLGDNTWLNGVPAELLDHVDDERLVAAAMAVIEGE